MVKKAIKFWGSMGFAATVLSSMVAVSGQGIAQNLRPPAELPLQSFTSEQYVDSTGCAFIRTGQGASTDWIPRISRDRRQICGLPPSLSQMAAAPVAPAPVVGAAPVTRPAQAPMRLREPVGVAPAAAPVMAIVPPVPSPSNNSNRCIIRARDGSVTEIRSRTAIRCGPQPIHPADGLARSQVMQQRNARHWPCVRQGSPRPAFSDLFTQCKSPVGQPISYLLTRAHLVLSEGGLPRLG